MEHTNPTLLAKTHRSGSSCQHWAGACSQGEKSGHDPLLENPLIEAAFLLPVPHEFLETDLLNHAERLQLSESARFSMDEEIIMLRKMIKNFTRAAGTHGEEDYPDNLARALDLLGLTCSRLASVLRVNMVLAGPQDDALRKQIEESLATFLSEIQTQKGTKKQSGKVVKHA